MTDPAALLSRGAPMRKAFAVLMHQPGLADSAIHALLVTVDRMHGRNVAEFGWRDAEQLRAQAFADAASPLPAGEASESDFADFERSTR